MADIFVSYTSSDREWAFWIAKELKALGHTPHIHEWEIGGGDNIYAWMEQRHDAADHVLCVVSDDYLKAPYSTLERHAALWQAASKRPGFVLFVAVKPCRLPTLADHIRRCELYGVPEEAARTRFLDFMHKPKAQETAAFPGKVFAVSNIPIRAPRSRHAHRLHQCLLSARNGHTRGSPSRRSLTYGCNESRRRKAELGRARLNLNAQRLTCCGSDAALRQVGPDCN
jgi:TIR domain